MENQTELHEKAIKILEGIQHFKDQKKCLIESREGVLGNFPRLVNKCNHQIEIQKMCINRMQLYYMKHIVTIKNSIQNEN